MPPARLKPIYSDNARQGADCPNPHAALGNRQPPGLRFRTAFQPRLPQGCGMQSERVPGAGIVRLT
jgi:hypothetical protein